MYFRVTRKPETGNPRKTDYNIHDLVGYVEAESRLEALAEAREEYGDDVFVRQINCIPDDDIWPPDEAPIVKSLYLGDDPNYGDYNNED